MKTWQIEGQLPYNRLILYFTPWWCNCFRVLSLPVCNNDQQSCGVDGETGSLCAHTTAVVEQFFYYWEIQQTVYQWATKGRESRKLKLEGKWERITLSTGHTRSGTQVQKGKSFIIIRLSRGIVLNTNKDGCLIRMKKWKLPGWA